jgi:hypothetical protein
MPSLDDRNCITCRRLMRGIVLHALLHVPTGVGTVGDGAAGLRGSKFVLIRRIL